MPSQTRVPETTAKPAESAPSPPSVQPSVKSPTKKDPANPVEIGGPSGPEPTRYGDWERNGRCVDF